MITYPRGVPRLRDQVIQLWDQYGTKMISYGDASPEAEIGALRRSELLWVHADMCRLWDAAEKSLPVSTTLTAQDLPSDFGFVVLDEPLLSIDAVRADESRMRIRAFSWALARVQGDLAVHLAFYMDTSTWEELRQANSGYSSPLVYTGCSEWFFDTTVDDFANKVYEDFNLWAEGGPPKRAQDSIIEDRRRLASLLMLLHQPVVVDTIAPVTRQEQRATERKGKKIEPVRILTLREIRRPQGEADEEHAAVDWSHRWVVNGHWRNQWYPSEERHRPIWIAPFVKGPEDKPLLVRETIRAWRR